MRRCDKMELLNLISLGNELKGFNSRQPARVLRLSLKYKYSDIIILWQICMEDRVNIY